MTEPVGWLRPCAMFGHVHAILLLHPAAVTQEIGPLNDASGRASRSALRTINMERDALATLAGAVARAPLRDAIDEAARIIAVAQGRVVVTGIGKSGLVGRKIAATLASTGTPTVFLHPVEASHGDLGMITRQDVVMALSWSGETSELGDVVSYCKRFAVPLIAITSQEDSTLARRADLSLCLPVVEEACPNRLAPTSSTILQAAIGDALAVALIEVRGFSSEDFRIFHPRGQLAAQLLRIDDIMASDDAVPSVGEEATILDAMLEMSLKRFGVTGVVGPGAALIGAFTDGDLRRSLTSVQVDCPVRDFMTNSPLSVEGGMLVSAALALMNSRNISQLFVCEGATLVGIVHLQDVLRAGVV